MLSNRPNTDSQAKLEELWLKLERRLMDPVFRKDCAQVSALLAEGFREFGSSGRVWSRDQILNPSETGQAGSPYGRLRRQYHRAGVGAGHLPHSEDDTRWQAPSCFAQLTLDPERRQVADAVSSGH
jgi:hypothetical protein